MTTEHPDEKSLSVVHQEIERRDEQQILDYLMGGVVDEYVYSFPAKTGGTTVGLSWAGTREMAQLRGNIRVSEEPNISDCGDYWRGMALAEDIERNVALWGGCHQPKLMKVHVYDKEGNDTGEIQEVPDPFAFEKCVAKTQRNALKAIMPVTAITKFIIHYCEVNNIPLPSKLKKTQQKAIRAGASKSPGSRKPAHVNHIEKTPEQLRQEAEQIPTPSDESAKDIGTAWDDCRKLTDELKIADDKLKIWWRHFNVEAALEDFKLSQPPDKYKAEHILQYRRGLLELKELREKFKRTSQSN